MEEQFERLNERIFVCVSPQHKFGTDAFLLADFAAPKHRDTVCDLGTGCGIIPLILEKRFSPKHITGVDIQLEAIAQFQRGIEKSGLGDKIKALIGDIKNIGGILPGGTFDVVTANPPYKTKNTGLKNQLDAHTIARHEVLCTIWDICLAAGYLLKFGGSFCVCQRPERLIDTIEAFKSAKIEPKELQFVAKDKNTPPFLFLLKGRKGGNPHLRVKPLFCMYNEGTEELSPEVKKVYGEV